MYKGTKNISDYQISRRLFYPELTLFITLNQYCIMNNLSFSTWSNWFLMDYYLVNFCFVVYISGGDFPSEMQNTTLKETKHFH